MRLFEFAGPANGPDIDTGQLAALTKFLTGRATDTNAQQKISIAAFNNLASGMGINLTADQLKELSLVPPLSNLIADVQGDDQTGEVIFKGAEEPAPNMSVDQARDTVNSMAKRAASKKGL
jgi:hypothetical protein